MVKGIILAMLQNYVYLQSTLISLNIFCMALIEVDQ